MGNFSYDWLPLLKGWTLETKTFQFENVNKNEASVTNTIEGPGWLLSVIVFTTDSKMEISLNADQINLTASPSTAQSLYRYPNNGFVYVGQYSPSSGTAGSFSISYNPSVPLPFNERVIATFKLSPQSTQDTAYAEISAFVALINNTDEFVQSVARLNRAFGTGILTPPAPPAPAPPHAPAPARPPVATPVPRQSPFMKIAGVEVAPPHADDEDEDS
ncbi:MAG: hypothetical protein JRM97_08915 [Nitrososphaerota archaeon]|nr:hypothetical protein [Nitrososphaerota archaeon]MDG7032735.1 hypothetical protein [Nitrososphaerota archaeon]